MTLGDFWECENIWSDWKDDKGYSLVFIQSEKGKMFFDIIQEAIVSKEADIEKVLTYNSKHACISVGSVFQRFIL